MTIWAEEISAAPAGSEKVKAKVCEEPLPLLGVTETGVGPDTELGTVHVPLRAQPLPSEAFCTNMYTFLEPANAEVKLNARFRVRVVPEDVTDDAPAFTEHWLFCKVPALPTCRLD